MYIKNANLMYNIVTLYAFTIARECLFAAQARNLVYYVLFAATKRGRVFLRGLVWRARLVLRIAGWLELELHGEDDCAVVSAVSLILSSVDRSRR